MRAFVVLNPSAGQSADEPVREALEKAFGSHRIQYEIHETSADDKPADVVRAHLGDDIELIVAVGGDGTISQVIDGLAGSMVPLGIVPTGTGNLIARELGIPTSLDDAVALIAGSPRQRAIDAMRIGGGAFILNVSVGLSAEVVSDTTRGEKNRLGRFAYTWTTIRKLFKLRHRRLVVEVDGIAREYRAIEVAIMNGGKLAKDFHPLGPEILIDDGQLDVYILDLMGLGDVLRYVGMLVTFRSGASPLRIITAKQCVTIRSTRSLPVQADGDVIGTTPVDVELLPHAVTVLVPATS